MTEIIVIVILLLLFVFIFYKNNNINTNNNTNNNQKDKINTNNKVREKEYDEDMYIEKPVDFNPYVYDRMYNPYYFLGSPYTYPYVSYAYDPRPVPWSVKNLRHSRQHFTVQNYRTNRPVFYTEHRPNYNYTKKIHRKNHRK
jgi:hypothetical protein